MWQIMAVIRVIEKDGWQKDVHVPTFFLDETIVGAIDSEGMEHAAIRVIDPLNQMFSIRVNAVKIS